jgi:hypothetical protein
MIPMMNAKLEYRKLKAQIDQALPIEKRPHRYSPQTK